MVSWKGNNISDWRDKTGLLDQEQGFKACAESGQHGKKRKTFQAT